MSFENTRFRGGNKIFSTQYFEVKTQYFDEKTQYFDEKTQYFEVKTQYLNTIFRGERLPGTSRGSHQTPPTSPFQGNEQRCRGRWCHHNTSFQCHQRSAVVSYQNLIQMASKVYGEARVERWTTRGTMFVPTPPAIIAVINQHTPPDDHQNPHGRYQCTPPRVLPLPPRALHKATKLGIG